MRPSVSWYTKIISKSVSGWLVRKKKSEQTRPTELTYITALLSHIASTKIQAFIVPWGLVLVTHRYRTSFARFSRQMFTPSMSSLLVSKQWVVSRKPSSCWRYGNSLVPSPGCKRGGRKSPSWTAWVKAFVQAAMSVVLELTESKFTLLLLVHNWTN